MCDMLKIALLIAVQRNLQGIMPASRILEGVSALPLFTEVPGKGLSGKFVSSILHGLRPMGPELPLCPGAVPQGDTYI